MRVCTILSIFILGFLNISYGESLSDRYVKASERCNARSLARPRYKTPDESMRRYYQPSQVQRFLTPVYVGIVDEFGSVLQGMISGRDEVYVRPYLRRIGRDIRDYASKNNLSKQEQVCMSTCYLHYLMSPGDVNPYLSLDLAVASGEGFCRHFSQASEQILSAAGIKVETETSLEHMFLKLRLDNTLYYHDPLNERGDDTCTFYSTN